MAQHATNRTPHVFGLIPGLDVIRPSNSIETIFAYKYLFSNTKNPSSFTDKAKFEIFRL